MIGYLLFKRVFHIGAFIAVIICMMTSFSCSKKIEEYPKDFYRYNKVDIEKLMNIEDFEIWNAGVDRNSNGTYLRVSDLKSNYRVVMSCDGALSRIELPSPSTWLDDDNKVVAWRDELGIVHFRNGYTEKTQIARYRSFDPSGNFFWRDTVDGKLGVFSTKNPEKPVLIFDANFLRLFFKEGELHVFAWKHESFFDAFQYKVENDHLKEYHRYSVSNDDIGAKISVQLEDYNIDTEDLILVDLRDSPFHSKWYLYNNRMNDIKYIGKAFDYGFFLKCDVLMEVTEKLK